MALGTKKLAFLHDSLRAYFCAEALLVQGYMPQQELAAQRYAEVIPFLHDLVAGAPIHTARDLLFQLQQSWSYALHLHERGDPAALHAIEQAAHLLATHAHLLHQNPAEEQYWRRNIRRQRARSLYKFLGDFRTALEIYSLNYQERRAQKDTIGQIRELNAAAKVFHDTCDFPAALVLLARCLTSWEEALGVSGLSPADTRILQEGLAQSLGALGETLLKLQDIQGAMTCFERNRILMTEVTGDVARADVRLADCTIELARRASEEAQGTYYAHAEQLLQQAERVYQDHAHALSFVWKGQLKLRLAQRRWPAVVTMAEQWLPQVSIAFVKGYLFLYQGQALLECNAPEAASEALAASTAAFTHEHYLLEAAGVRLEQAAAELRAGRDGLSSCREATTFVETFQQQYATLCKQYFTADIARWRATGLAWLVQRFDGLHERLAGHIASAPAFFTHLCAAIVHARAIVASPHVPTQEKIQAVRRVVQTYWLL